MNVVTIKDKKYPVLLRKTGNSAPKQLYYKGMWNAEIFENCLAVVGSRHLTSYGRKITEQLVTEIAASGITIVSGFMCGGDEAAHKAAVRAGGKTIAVMPCGIDVIHPEYQKDLYNEILENNGLIVSEFEGNFPPDKWTYPKRNRIVAGLSSAVLVVEAALKSGTLITTNYAKKFNRKIFAVPGPINSENSKGTLKLIKEEAILVTSAQDILNYYKIRPETENFKIGAFNKSMPPAGRASFKTELEQKIIEHLKREPMNIDDLARVLGIRASELCTTVSLMELKGIIAESGKKYYIN